MRPIFRSTGQALSFSYLVEAFELCAESQFAKFLRRAVQEAEERAISTVNFDGLSPQEIRGQCAMIRSAVESKLVGIEKDVIKARHGLTMTTRCPVEGVRTELAEYRRESILRVAEYFHPRFDKMPLQVVAWLVTREVGNARAMQPPYSTIAQHYGSSPAAMSRARPKLRDAILAYENSAYDRLTPTFEDHGVVASDYVFA